MKPGTVGATRRDMPRSPSIESTKNGRLLALSGPRNPYDGRFGVIEKGALAGLIVVAGDPTQDLGLFDDPSANLKVIMKDGVFHKNPLPQ